MTISNLSHLVSGEVSRRGFLAASGGLSFAVVLGTGLSAADPAMAQATEAGLKPNVWVTIGTDDSVVVMIPTGEMGQGTTTALPLILAEELDADWSKVRIELAPPNPRVYGNPHPLLNGGQASLASIAIPGYFTPLRMAGAQARRVLMDAAATKWGVPVAELSTDTGRVIHAASGQRMSYGEIAKFATLPAELPKITVAELKKPEQYKLIGRAEIGRTDLLSKVTGQAKYGIDMMVPDMVYATVLESPVEGCRSHGRARRDPGHPHAFWRGGAGQHGGSHAHRTQCAQAQGHLDHRGRGGRHP